MAWIETKSGIKFDYNQPKKSMISIYDVAHSLANQCRFNGHTKEFYSVAQHSVLVSYYLKRKQYNRQVQLWGLLHDAGESYVGDMPKPLKHLMDVGRFIELENNILKTISAKFNLPWPMPECIHHADNVILVCEKRDLMNPSIVWDEWPDMPEPDKEIVIMPMNPDKSKSVFLSTFCELVVGYDDNKSV